MRGKSKKEVHIERGIKQRERDRQNRSRRDIIEYRARTTETFRKGD